MIQAYYNELDGPEGVTRRLSVKGHANYAPAGQDIVCAGASILMQALVWMLAGEEGADCAAADGPGGPRITVTAGPGKRREADQRLAGSFELAKTGLALLAERYPDNLRFADTSRRGEEGMVDLQLFARPRQERRKGGPALSREQERQAVASGFRIKFDVIFCRNVMIYFDQPTRDALVRRFWEQRRKGCSFFLLLP